MSSLDLKAICLTLLCAFIGSVGNVEYKRGAENLYLNIQGLITNYHLIVGMLLYAVMTILYVYVLKESHLSLVYPIFATSYLWTMIFSKVFFNEPVNLMNWIGTSLIMVGIFFTLIR